MMATLDLQEKALEKHTSSNGKHFTDLDRWWELNIFLAMDLNI
jgi:hypothetical protein